MCHPAGTRSRYHGWHWSSQDRGFVNFIFFSLSLSLTHTSPAAANYAVALHPAEVAKAKGFSQVLWLSGPEHSVSEVGTMNIFMVWKTPSGTTELITPPLDGTILPGVTRQSVLELAKARSDILVTERKFTMAELVLAFHEDR